MSTKKVVKHTLQDKTKFLWKAIGAFFRLDNRQRRMILTRKMDGTQTPEYWLMTLRKLCTFDYYADQVRGSISTLFWWMLISSLIYLFLHPFFFEMTGLWFLQFYLHKIFWFLLYVSPFVLLVYLAMKSVDIPNYLREFIVPLIAILHEEMDTTALLELQVDLSIGKTRKRYRTARHKNFKYSKLAKTMIRLPWLIVLTAALLLAYNMWIIRNPHDDDYLVIFVSGFIGTFVAMIISLFFGPPYPRITTTTFLFPWLKITAKLADKSLIHCELEDTILRRKVTRSKRGRSGKTKIKTKVKHKVKQNYMVKVALPAKVYTSPAHVGSSYGMKITRKADEKKTIFKVQKKGKTTQLHSVPDVNRFLSMLSNVYRKVKQVEN